MTASNITPSDNPAGRLLPSEQRLSAEDMSHHAEQAAQFLKLLANPHRLMILCHLFDGEVCVSELNRHLPLSQSALSQHLAVLRHSGLVTTRRQQQTIFYSLAGAEVTAIMQVLYTQFCQPSTGPAKK